MNLSEAPKKGGYKALRSSKVKGLELKINKREARKLIKWLKKDPRQMHFDFGLWTLEMIGGPAQFKAQIQSVLHSLQKQKDNIIKLFSHPDVAYAAIN